MEIIRIFNHSTGFDEVYEGHINAKLDKLIVGKINKQYNESTTITPRMRWMHYELCSISTNINRIRATKDVFRTSRIHVYQTHH
ncbi:MAG: hypothetical protein CVU95_08820 [Firmicutes bacterium HGW-Firmicutes-2]|jgi:hypothetical protein|nr:MAG: hypothetical protein CVU95_08820 [Firmicutes bacterium HGW-Firmicutes-2]